MVGTHFPSRKKRPSVWRLTASAPCRKVGGGAVSASTPHAGHAPVSTGSSGLVMLPVPQVTGEKRLVARSHPRS